MICLCASIFSGNCVPQTNKAEGEVWWSLKPVVRPALPDGPESTMDSPHYYSDLHATILHQLGIDHKKLKVQALGRTMRLVEEGGPINEIIA